jgi:hypothetical protein
MEFTRDEATARHIRTVDHDGGKSGFRQHDRRGQTFAAGADDRRVVALHRL